MWGGARRPNASVNTSKKAKSNLSLCSAFKETIMNVVDASGYDMDMVGLGNWMRTMSQNGESNVTLTLSPHILM